MLKYVKKFTLDILPSVVATIIGAYIVNHYIVAKPAADSPAAAISAANPKASPKASDAAADVASIPEHGVKAKGISEKAIMEKATVEKPTEKAADKPAETASIPADARRHLSASREKSVARVVPQVAAPAAIESAPLPVEAAIGLAPERDANDLARAAIDRLRGTNETPARTETRAPEAPRVAAAPAMQPLPPPIMVSTPPVEVKLPHVPAMRSDDSRRLTPPADIPAPPLDLRAEASVPSMREHTSVAEDMLSAAKSVFHAVLPK